MWCLWAAASCFSEMQWKLRNVGSSELKQEPNVFLKVMLLLRRTSLVLSKSFVWPLSKPGMGLVWLKNKSVNNSKTVLYIWISSVVQISPMLVAKIYKG